MIPTAPAFRQWLRRLLYATPPRYRAGFFANILGLQILRALTFEVRYQLRKIRFWRTNEISDVLEREGIYVINDFLSCEQLKQLELETKQFLENARVVLDARPRAWSYELHKLSNDGFQSVSKTFSREFFEESHLYGIVECFMRKRINLLPRAYFIRHQYHTADLGLCQNDFQDSPHVDVSYRSVKAVLYLGDTDDSNGPFCYAKGSHRFTLRRLLGEYLHSMTYFRNIKKHGNPLSGLNLSLFKAELLKPITGKKNTLIIFDARGVHRRGDFKSDHPRDTVFIDFRDGDSWMNSIVGTPIIAPKLKAFRR